MCQTMLTMSILYIMMNRDKAAVNLIAASDSEDNTTGSNTPGNFTVS